LERSAEIKDANIKEENKIGQQADETDRKSYEALYQTR